MNNLITFVRERVAALDAIAAVQLAFIFVALFFIYRFLRMRRAFPIAIGMIITYAVYLVAGIFNFTFIHSVLDAFIKHGAIVILLIFAPELRSMLEAIGNFTLPFRLGRQTKKNADEIINALNTLSKTKTGALIFMERKTKLESMAARAVPLNANISSGLLINIFTGAGPLHDGGVLIRNGRIHAAACKVSMDSTLKLPHAYGARHQAAVNLSASCDAIVLTVSEEDRTVSVAERGELRHLSAEEIPSVVYRAMNVKGYADSGKKSAAKQQILYKSNPDGTPSNGKNKSAKNGQSKQK